MTAVAPPPQDIWQEVLEPSLKNVDTLSVANVLLLGNDGSGKSTLLSKFQHVDDPERGLDVTYGYIDIRHPGADISEEPFSRLNIWEFGEKANLQQLLHLGLNKESANTSCVMIVLDSTAPWTFMELLEKYGEALQKHVQDLHLPSEQTAALERKAKERFLKFVDAAPTTPRKQTLFASAGSFPLPTPEKPMTAVKEDEQLLEDGILTHNIGVPIVVVLSKSDNVKQWLKTKSFNVDYVQYQLRKWCVKYGAALVYTAAKPPAGQEVRNDVLLLDYVEHLMFGFPNLHPANVLDHSSVFVPMGWDSDTKLDALMTVFMKQSPLSVDDVKNPQKYNEFVKPPLSHATVDKSVPLEAPIQSAKEQEFLLSLKQMDGQYGQSPTPTTSSKALVSPNHNDNPQHTPRNSTPMGSPPPHGEPSADSRSAGMPRIRSTSGMATDSPKTEYEEIGQIFRDLLQKKGRGKAPGGSKGNLLRPASSARMHESASSGGSEK